MKKLLVVLLAFAFVFAVNVPDEADAAKRGGSYKAPKKSFTNTPSKQENVSKTETPKSGTTTPGSTTAAKPGFFGGGGFMKGLMIGGLAGMLFGGMFGGMGFLGNMLGFLVNMLAIYVLIMIAVRVFKYFKDRKEQERKRFQ